ncbi:MAG: NAD-binding protein [Chromatiaceae bacterium]|nr:NAD-binding protein [Chromatiaceae bacterium]MCF7993969.1 NAD-binding protein [Chromatiaceae bacterium]MCF8015665.1 NAD-binding protein [Chromatiaceae bacterium]
MSIELSGFKDFVVMISWDKFAALVADQLVDANRQVIALSDDLKTVERINSAYDSRQLVAIEMDVFNFEEVKRLPMDRAFGVYVNLASDRERLLFIYKLRKYFEDLSIISPVVNPELKESFSMHRQIFPLSRDEISAKILASHLFERDVATYLNELMSPALSDDDHDIQQYRVLQDNPFCNQMYGDVFIALKKNYNVILIGLSKKTTRGYQLRKNPSDETLVQEGDYLIAILNGRSAQELDKAFGVVEGA